MWTSEHQRLRDALYGRLALPPIPDIAKPDTRLQKVWAILYRHPGTTREVAATLGLRSDLVGDTIAGLVRDGRVKRIGTKRAGGAPAVSVWGKA